MVDSAPAQVVERIIRDAATLVDCDRCSLFMIDMESDELVAAAFDVQGTSAEAMPDAPGKYTGSVPHKTGHGACLANHGRASDCPGGIGAPRAPEIRFPKHLGTVPRPPSAAAVATGGHGNETGRAGPGWGA